MSGILTRFRVVNLHGRRTFDIPIADNRLVLVGENGTGKSTTANMVYYFLTRQWSRLREYKFSAIEAVVGGAEFRVTAEQLELHRGRRLAERVHQPVVQRALFRFAAEHELEEILESGHSVARFAEELGVPIRHARELLVQYLNDPGSAELQETTAKLAKAFTSQILYLPTYRRIEQDLKSIFRGVDVERLLRERLHHSRTSATEYIELVEFGMEDVERTITSRMTAIKEGVRTGLNNLTGTYLRDVIQGIHAHVGVEKLHQITPVTLELMFARLDEATLPPRDKDRLKRRVADMLGKTDLDNEDRVIALFLTKLLELYRTQEQAERDVRDFVRVCNEYLVGKRLVYDDTNYTISIEHMVDSANGVLFATDAVADVERLQLKMLSSGEKQIVSLFSHLYFSGGNDFFVVIDEPELSLSVPWQRRFLPDILRSGVSTGLFAVTHSPFIWENELEPYVHSLTEFVEQGDVVHQ